MKLSSNPYNSIERIRNEYPKMDKTRATLQGESVYPSFESILEGVSNEATSELKFSKHANERLEDRNIRLTRDQLSRLEEGTQKAKKKGINESLVVVDGLSFIVSVKNNTVITAVNKEDEQVFTNIDGAVIM